MSIIEREREEVQVDERERRASVLEAAALEIEYRGWCQGVYYDRQGAVCMEGAISFASGGGMAVCDVYRTFFKSYRHGDPSLAEWNDFGNRTAAEVCFVLRWRAQEIRDGR